VVFVVDSLVDIFCSPWLLIVLLNVRWLTTASAQHGTRVSLGYLTSLQKGRSSTSYAKAKIHSERYGHMDGISSHVSFSWLIVCNSFVISQMLLFSLQSTLGRVTIQIDKVVTEGVYSGFFSLSHDGGKDGSRTLEIEIVWSNRPSNDSM
jgi:hypothetical protein